MTDSASRGANHQWPKVLVAIKERESLCRGLLRSNRHLSLQATRYLLQQTTTTCIVSLYGQPLDRGVKAL
jgi:hypothetical protein